MQYRFTVTIETDEANPEELEEAITDMLRVADMPNGDTLYIDHPVVEYMRPPGQAHSCDIPGCAVCDPCHGL